MMSWHFTSPGALRACLEEYTEYHMAQGAPPDGGDPDATRIDRAYRIYCQNQAIDVGMWMLKREDHAQWDLLHGFYRMGAWNERRGWYLVARMLRWPVPDICPGSVRCGVRGDSRYHLSLCRSGYACDELHERFLNAEDDAINVLYGLLKGHSKDAVRIPIDTHSVPVIE
jgi:hypothetical protein